MKQCNVLRLGILFLFSFLYGSVIVYSQVDQAAGQTNSARELKGEVIDGSTGDKLVFATIGIEGTNIATIANAEGNFAIKIPDSLSSKAVLQVSFLGYQPRNLAVSDLTDDFISISLQPSPIALEEVSVIESTNARELVRSMLKERDRNYEDELLKMTAFYRETIRKRKKDASLSEAVVNIYKQPYTSNRQDIITLFKSRKTTNYNRLDTVALKLQGGPYTPLFIDIMKYPEYIFSGGQIDNYNFSFDRGTMVNDRPVFVVNFRQREDIDAPLFYGKLYLDKENYALVSAIYNLNLENREAAAEMLVRRKPSSFTVYPTEATYRVDYRRTNGKWLFSYGNVQLAFMVDKKGKWFNSKYTVSSEIAVTDWQVIREKGNIKLANPLRTSVILADEASGFADPDFWGTYNVIEPDKSIESAIRKIQRQISREER